MKDICFEMGFYVFLLRAVVMSISWHHCTFPGHFLRQEVNSSPWNRKYIT